MLTVHHLNHPRSQRVLWLLEELGLPYEIKFYQRNAKNMLALAGAARDPSARQSRPVVADDGVVIAETGAIVEYIVEKSGGRLRPMAGTPEQWLRWTYWLHYSEGSLITLLLMRLIFSLLAGAFAGPDARVRASRSRHGRCRTGIDSQLKTHISTSSNWNSAAFAMGSPAPTSPPPT